MLKRLKIAYFQSWEEGEFVLHPGLNVIIGESDKGKSSVGRAFTWFLKNSLQDFSFRSTFADKKDVTKFVVEDDKGNVFSRERVPGTASQNNRYRLNRKVFKAVGKGVPKEISDAVNLSEYNVQLQHDRYFLLQDTPAAAAKVLNSVTGLESIDFLLSHINSTDRTADAGIRTRKKEIVELKAEANRYKNVDEHVKAVGLLETYLNQRAVYRRERTDIYQLRDDYFILQAELNRYAMLDEVEEKTGDLFQLADDVMNDLATRNMIIELIGNFESIGLEIEKCNEGIEAKEILDELALEIRKQKKVRVSREEFGRLINEHGALSAEITGLNREIEVLEKQYKKEMGSGICPLCLRSI
ncbi:MAG: hypothetical protein FVQ80_06670 [Planctomycetes bacterium]|nr:hypothetical protein [Planctomycetota bacterium]